MATKMYKPPEWMAYHKDNGFQSEQVKIDPPGTAPMDRGFATPLSNSWSESEKGAGPLLLLSQNEVGSYACNGNSDKRESCRFR